MPKPLSGHQETQQQLEKLLENQRFPHALLLHGPQGIGKRLLADHLTHRLICGKYNENSLLVEGGEVSLAYNQAAPQAHQLAAGSCPDYHLLTPEEAKKSISIKQVREVLEALLRSADTARVVVVDALEHLTTEAANTLLKTLEEPRPGIYFLLISHQLSAVLSTIRSRSRLLACHPLTRQEMLEFLEQNHLPPGLVDTAQGAPGLIAGATGQSRRKLLESLSNNENIPPTTPDLLPTLLTHLSTRKPTLARARAYRKIADLHHKQQEVNLPPTLVNEAALALLHD